ncbi:anhydro-N-acetylmuramic acid kinase [Seonamhaeicola sp. S2-3]|uniref:anhydro-N-acetylmuramic acid kinase n=1 Tax=Seonamhaeicola sp. S2-3 TaxID=1936081 RepID=UPI0009727E79|nr:anhydro-N-acetylmuramic acid kinase [Seonamhaeicola sp. S2-3]APY11396.1 anhydro-N-acetylmuramic acid kinase [Seonamhaeicola sp. S2-3]
MIKTSYNVIGVMSGTSLDGIDLIYVSFNHNNSKWLFKIHAAETVSYNKEWKEKLRNLVAYSIEELHQIDKEYTSHLAYVINKFITKHSITEIDAVCSHGHTALHQPENRITYQIGNMPHMATLLKNKVVCDFRAQDVALGGQGAPLVPIGDKLLFSEYNFCINLGGFANISSDINNERIAYDICPVNIVLNQYVKNLGLNYDDEGKIAASGTVNIDLLQQLNALSFYNELPPKSLGLEWVKTNVFPIIDAFNLDIKDVLRTFVEHIAIQISNSISQIPQSSVLITGGGAYNLFLIERIEALSSNKIIIPSKDIIEFKEALIFGFLGALKLRNETNCLKSVTGASKNHSSGKIYFPSKITQN